ncbi:Os12g0234800 [Linum perenne]
MNYCLFHNSILHELLNEEMRLEISSKEYSEEWKLAMEKSFGRMDKEVYVFLAMVKIVLKATSRRQVLPAVPNLLHSVQVEGTFSDGTKLITVHDAIACENEDL